MSKTILLVEDDQFLGPLLKARLEKEGLGVILVPDVDAAVAELKKQRPDLLLLDIMLPGKSGFEAMAVIKADPQLSGVPIIIVSALGQEEDVQKGRNLGATEYLVKANYPSIEDLVAKIKGFLGS